MSEPDPNLKKWIAMSFRGFIELSATCEELKMTLAKLHERFMGEDSDKVIGEMNHRIKLAASKLLLEIEQKHPELAAAMDDFGRSGDISPPQP